MKKGYEPCVLLITIEQSIAAFESRIVKTEAAIPAIKLKLAELRKAQIISERNSSPKLKKI